MQRRAAAYRDRNITDPARANVTVPIAKPGLMHRLVDPDAAMR